MSKNPPAMGGFLSLEFAPPPFMYTINAIDSPAFDPGSRITYNRANSSHPGNYIMSQVTHSKLLI
ncbi:MAG: hypothetical protein ACRC1N_15345, partial [Aeromonas sobria]